LGNFRADKRDVGRVGNLRRLGDFRCVGNLRRLGYFRSLGHHCGAWRELAVTVSH
jgi:hypothetical protein